MGKRAKHHAAATRITKMVRRSQRAPDLAVVWVPVWGETCKSCQRHVVVRALGAKVEFAGQEYDRKCCHCGRVWKGLDHGTTK